MDERFPISNPLASRPSPWLAGHFGLIRAGGRVLDLACGHGRHARALAALGHPVLAVDRDVQALATLAGTPGITTLAADLEGAPWPLADQRFDAILVSHYLHRPLFAHLLGALAGDGVLLYETFARGNEQFGRPRNPDFLLHPNELLTVFAPALTIVSFEQGVVDTPHVAVVQRLCAVGPAYPWPPRLPTA